MKKALENERKEKLMKKAFIELLPEVTMIDKERFLNFYNRRVQVFERYLDSKFDDAIFNVILPDSFDVRESFKSWSYKCEEHGSNFNHRCTHCYMNTMLTIDDTNKYFNFELTYTIGFRGKSLQANH